MEAATPYVTEHECHIRKEYPRHGSMWHAKEHNHSFLGWFKDKVFYNMSNEPDSVSDMVKWLAYGPKFHVNSFKGYDINGYSFYTKHQDAKSSM